MLRSHTSLAICLALLLAPLAGESALPDWARRLSQPEPGPFPLPRPEETYYKFGWFAITGGEAFATFSKRENIVQLEAHGGSTGFVRSLWKLDASHKATARASTLRPLKVRQVEAYGWKTVITSLSFTDESVTDLRTQKPADPTPPVEMKFKFPNVYDLQTALLYVRSQRLQPGDRIRLVVFPANTPYLATVTVLGREKIQVKAGKFNALKLEIHLKRINPKYELEQHKKFKRAVAWLSDDADRMVLRVEAEIFVGSVWAELQSVKFTPQ